MSAVNGPPTPPPTTAVEMQDEARSNAAAAASTSTAAAPPTTAPAVAVPGPPPAASAQDPYQIAFQELSNLALQSKWRDLMLLAQGRELNGDSRPTQIHVTVPLVLASLIEDELQVAHFALQRLPQNLHSTPLIIELVNLLSATNKRKYAKIYSGAQNLFHGASQASGPDTPLNGLVAGMVTTFIESFRSRTFELLSKAYTSLPLSLAETYLGMHAEELVNAVSNKGWTYDPNTKILTPKAPPTTTTKVAKGSLSGPSTLAKFDFVATSVARLELVQ